MECFIHNENIALYERLIAESELNPSRNEDRHRMLLTLLAEEMAKDVKKTLDSWLVAYAQTGRCRSNCSGAYVS